MAQGDLIARALAHLEADADNPKYALALDQLIQAWRKTRAIEVAEVIDAVEDALAIPVFTDKDKATTWTIAANDSKKADERGALIRAIPSMPQHSIVDALRITEKWDDPRVGTAIISLLKELRFAGAKSQSFWRHVFEHVRVQRDPRYARLMKTLPSTWHVGPSMQKWLTNHLEDASSFNSPAELSEAEQAALTRIREIARAASETRKHGIVGEHGGATSAEQLLEDIYANPDDDAARLVYADWLLERGDPRGEFISLQLRKPEDKDKAAWKRERELLKAHKKEWMGRIASVVGGDLEFRRGFLATAVMKFRHQRDVEQFGSLDEWLTLEELEWGAGIVRKDQVDWSRWIGPAMRNIRIARGCMAKGILDATHRALQTHKDVSSIKPWRLRVLEPWFRGLTAETFRELLESPLLADLELIDMRGSGGDPRWFEGSSRYPKEVVVFADITDERLRDWRETLMPTSVLTLSTRTWDETRFRFHRADGTAKPTSDFSRLRIELRPQEKIKSIEAGAPGDQPRVIKNLIATLGDLKPRSITEITALLEVSGEMVDITDQIKAAAKNALI